MKIALVTPMLPVPHDAARGRYIHEIARSLSRLADVRVYLQQMRYPLPSLFEPQSSLYGTVGPGFALDGVQVEAFVYSAIPVLTRYLNGWLASRQLRQVVRDFKPDAFLAYWLYPDAYAAVRVAHTMGKPCIVGALGSDIHVRSGIGARLTRNVIADADALIVVSQKMRKTAIEEFGARAADTHTIVNGFNTDVFFPRDQQATRRELGIPFSAKLVTYVGRFVRAKGIVELIEAFASLTAEDKRVYLALVGGGVMGEELTQILRRVGCADRVLLPGALDPTTVARWLAASDLLCLPSWSEGYPNVVVEAIACGRPVVATDVGGTAEIVNDHNGILVPARSPSALRDAIARCLQATWDAASISRAIRRTWDDVAQETLAVCERALGAGRAVE